MRWTMRFSRFCAAAAPERSQAALPGSHRVSSVLKRFARSQARGSPQLSTHTFASTKPDSLVRIHSVPHPVRPLREHAEAVRSYAAAAGAATQQHDKTAAGAATQQRDAPSAGYLAEVEALRGVAIALVFLYHCDAVVRPGAHGAGALFAFVRSGHTGVSLFFMLSGFLLSQPFLVEAAGGRRVRRREYFARRALRIVPLYYLAILVSLWWLQPLAKWAEVSWPFWGFLNGLAPAYSLWPFSIGWWSLATEVQFYVLLPLLPVVARGLPSAIAVGGYLALYALFLLQLLQAPTVDANLFLLDSVFGRGWLFLSGIVGGHVWWFHGKQLRDRLARVRPLALGGSDALLLAILAVLSALLQWVAWIGPVAAQNRPNHVWHVAEGALWAGVLLVLLLFPLRGKALLVNPLMRSAGLVSYSLFLIHVPVVTIVLHQLQEARPGQYRTWDASSLLVCGGLFAVCIALSALSYRFVERPFLRLKARLPRTSSQPGDAPDRSML